MKLTIMTGAVLAVVALVAATVLAITNRFGQEEEAFTPNFPERVNHRVMLNPAEVEIDSHIEYYKDDGTKVVAQIKYKNGITRYMYYRPDVQTLEKIMDYAKIEDTDELWLLAESYLTEDGKRLEKHAVYRENGTIERKGERQEDGRYQTVYFAEDGVTVMVQKVFEPDETLFAEKAYHDDGTPKLITEWENSYLVTKTFRQDGTHDAVVENHHALQRGVFYRADGKTPKIGFFRNDEFTEFVYFDQAGTPEYKVRQLEDRFEVSAFDGGKLLYQQTLAPATVNDMSLCSGSNRIAQVREFKINRGYPYSTEVTRIFVLNKARPKYVVDPHTSTARTIYNLDDNGVVTSIEYQYGELDEDARKRLPSDLYKVGDKVIYDPEMFQQKDFECVDIPEKLDVPQIRIFRR